MSLLIGGQIAFFLLQKAGDTRGFEHIYFFFFSFSLPVCDKRMLRAGKGPAHGSH